MCSADVDASCLRLLDLDGVAFAALAGVVFTPFGVAALAVAASAASLSFLLGLPRFLPGVGGVVETERNSMDCQYNQHGLVLRFYTSTES